MNKISKKEVEMKTEDKPKNIISKNKAKKANPSIIEGDSGLVSLEVFISSCGLKFDQTAGFKHFAKQSKLHRMSVKDWHSKLQQFLTKEVKG